jgi:hypothetical protein
VLQICPQPENCISSYEPHAYCVVYSTVDRTSLRCAEETLQCLWKSDTVSSKAVILVANKTDLVRSRTVTTEGETQNKTGNVCITQNWGAFTKPQLPRKNNTSYTCVCVCASMGAQALACTCVRVVLLIQRAARCHISICGLSVSTIFLDIILYKWYDFREEVTEHKMYILIFFVTSNWNISHCKNNSARYCHKCDVFI